MRAIAGGKPIRQRSTSLQGLGGQSRPRNRRSQRRSDGAQSSPRRHSHTVTHSLLLTSLSASRDPGLLSQPVAAGPHYCQLALSKVRPLYMWRLNPYNLSSAGPGQPCRAAPRSSPSPRPPGHRRIAAAVWQTTTPILTLSPPRSICACLWRVAIRNPRPAVATDPGHLANEWRFTARRDIPRLALTKVSPSAVLLPGPRTFPLICSYIVGPYCYTLLLP